MNIFTKWNNNKRFTKSLALLSIFSFILSLIVALRINLNNAEKSKNDIPQSLKSDAPQVICDKDKVGENQQYCTLLTIGTSNTTITIISIIVI